MMIALRLANEGLGGGNPETILDMPVTTVLSMLDYSTFKGEYEATFHEMNKDRKD
jgi:hypothetical protein